jgi:hypothetical protein
VSVRANSSRLDIALMKLVFCIIVEDSLITRMTRCSGLGYLCIAQTVAYGIRTQQTIQALRKRRCSRGLESEGPRSPCVAHAESPMIWPSTPALRLTARLPGYGVS